MYKLTDDVEVTDLTLHRVGVDLTHVPATIGLLHLLYMKKPGAVLAVAHAYPMVLRYHVTRYRQYRLRVDAQPCDL